MVDRESRQSQNGGKTKRQLAPETFLSLAEEIFSSSDFTAALTRIAEGAAQVLGADAAAILLIDETNPELVIKASYNLSNAYISGMHLKMGVDSSGRAIVDCKLQVWEDAPAHLREVKEKDLRELIEREGIKSLVGAPIMIGERVAGTVNLYHFHPHCFKDNEIRAIELFARLAGVALRSAHRLQMREEKISSLDIVSETSQKIFQAQTPEEVYRLSIEASLRLVPCEQAILFLTNEQQGYLEVKFSLEVGREAPVEPFRVLLKEIPEQLWKGGQGIQNPFYTGDLPAEHPELLPLLGAKDFRSIAIVPVARGDKFLGALTVSHREPHQFRPEQLKLLRTTGNLLSLALERLDLVEKMRTRQHEIESALSFQTHLNTELLTLQQLSAALVSSLDLEEVLKLVVEGAKESLGFKKVLISLVDKSGRLFERKAWTGIPPEAAARLATQKPPVEYVRRHFQDRFRISRSYFIGHNEAPDVEDDQYSYVDRVKPVTLVSEDTWHPEDMLITPLFARDGTLIGIMSVDDPVDGKIPSRRKILSLEMFANAAAAALENSRAYAEERTRVRELAGIQSIGTTITAVLKLDQLIEEVVRTIQETFHYYFVGILLVEGGKLVVKSTSGAVSDGVNEFVLTTGERGITSWVAQSGEACLVRDVSREPRYLAADPNTRCEVAVPLTIKEQVIGVLNVEENEVGKLSEGDLKLLSTLAPQIAVAVENARLYEEKEKQAITDEKTGLFNFRHFQGVLREEFQRARRYRHPLSLLMLDVDHFKNYNDHWGHPRGDEVLKALAQILRESIRDVDVAVRYGGEEFMVVLPETQKPEAVAMAERIRCAVREHDFPFAKDQPNGRITVSIGVATFPDDAQGTEAVVDRVDQAMYRAKARGRDNVQAF
jgi:diguanylate cyclase (GGDEF)-like protein